MVMIDFQGFEEGKMGLFRTKDRNHTDIKNRTSDLSEFLKGEIGKKKFGIYQTAGVFHADYIERARHIKTVVKEYSVMKDYNKKNVSLQIHIGTTADKEDVDLFSFDNDLVLSVILPAKSLYLYDIIHLDCKIKPKKTKAKFENGKLYVIAKKKIL
jgi:hypothetical protein